MIFNQSEFYRRCEWGYHGVIQLAPTSNVVVIFDVLSFSTSGEIATSNGAVISPTSGKMNQHLIMPSHYRRSHFPKQLFSLTYIANKNSNRN
ncbi:hypothetical protein CEN47_14835 [Fischerella thermalis CCMEE 5319]|nr:hypothetical protein CEN47_14835 [Fischerella thermalis CCMEE 5319]